MNRRASMLVPLALAACAASEPAVLDVGNPRALTVDCASPPADLAARLWVSGYEGAFALSYDTATHTTTGTVDVAPGVVRKLTIDWFVPLGRGDGLDLVLAQAQGELNLVDGVQPTAEYAVSAEAISDGACLDMRFDTFAGAATVDLDGVTVPLCDLDDSCSGGDPASCTNLIETCSGSDPLDRTVEP